MIAIISSKRHAELLAKEARADAATGRDEFASAWRAIPGINAQREIDALCTQLLLASAACDARSPIQSIIRQCQQNAANLQLVAP